MHGPRQGAAGAALVVVPEVEAEKLARLAAAARGVAWPKDGRPVGPPFAFRADVTSHPGVETVVWATPEANEGILAIFSGSRLIAQLDRGLGQVRRVQILTLPGLPHHALMVDDQVRQLVGAFATEERRRIYSWDGRRMRRVYIGVLEAEQLQNRQWVQPKSPAVWRLARTTGQIDVRGDLLLEHRREEEWEAPGRPQAPVPPRGQFRLIEARSTETRYRWNPRLRRFDRLVPSTVRSAEP